MIALLGGVIGIIAELLAHVGGSTLTLGEFAFQKGLTYYFGYDGYIGSYFFVLDIAGLLVVPGVTWYAMSLWARTLGGALVLGWSPLRRSSRVGG